MSVKGTAEMQRKLSEGFLFFLFVSWMGWVYEVFLELIVYRWGYSDRGVLTGPYCPVYGLGAVLLLFCLRRLMETHIRLGRLSLTPIMVFIGIVGITTAVELAASYYMEWTSGGWAWDYTRFTPNFQGRIALNPSLRFGVGGMALLYFIYPWLKRRLARLSTHSVTLLAVILGGIFLIDYLCFLLL